MRSTSQIDRWPARCSARTARRFAADSSGASAVEYAVLALVAIAIAAVVFQIGGSVNTMFEKVEGLFTN